MNTQVYTPNWNRRTYSKEEFIEAWASSRSFSDCMTKLGLNKSGSNYDTLRDTANSLGLNDTHFLGQGWNIKGQPDHISLSDYNQKPLEYYLTVNSHAHSGTIKKRLITGGLLEERCYAPYCPNPVETVDGLTGDKVPTPLTLDHINGINNDNRLENLRLLCANCDRFNPTYCRGSGNRKEKITYVERIGLLICGCGAKKQKTSIRCKSCDTSSRKKNKNPHDLCICGGNKLITSKMCVKCEYEGRKTRTYRRLEKISWPSDEILLHMVKESSVLATGRKLGVSDNAVRKRLRSRGIL